ncbi:hypothetical protein L345_07290, partial [Ophiophagus hannah]
MEIVGIVLEKECYSLKLINHTYQLHPYSLYHFLQQSCINLKKKLEKPAPPLLLLDWCVCLIASPERKSNMAATLRAAKRFLQVPSKYSNLSSTIIMKWQNMKGGKKSKILNANLIVLN